MVFDGETNTWPSMDCTCTKNKSGEIKANIYCPKCSKRTLKEIRMSELEKIQKSIDRFASFQISFQEFQCSMNRCDEEKREYIKQLFYLNIFNALVLFKITEIAVMKPTKLFTLNNYSSFIALQHNTHITIWGKCLTAFQIRQDVIKNINSNLPSAFAVDNKYLHPLIEYAFFLPHGGNLKLSKLLWLNTDTFCATFKSIV